MATKPSTSTAARPARKRAPARKTASPEAPRPAGPAHDGQAGAGEGEGARGGGFGAFFEAMRGLALPQAALSSLREQYVAQAGRLWNACFGQAPRADPATAWPVPDRRFAAPDWANNPTAAWTAQIYLLNARTLMQMADSLEGDDKARARVRFAVQQWVDAMSPSNYLALNPEAQARALATGGESIAQGVRHLLQDLRQGHLSQTDESVFEVGRNVATTEGDVVFENEFFQLIEYKPLTATVHARPMLFVPPCINKFYILDLQPANSLIRHTVAQGHRTFVLSWRNPDDSMAACTWDDYVEHAVIRAIEVVREITAAKTINTLGFCIGGTLLATALGVLAARGRHPAESLTLLTTFLDFSDTGVLDIFVDEASVQMREATLGAAAPGGPRLLKGGELASAFSFLRPNDLVWNYVVGNYLKGETPPPFDLLYWNSDATNLPGPMYCWYLRHTYLGNRLREPGALTVCGAPLDLSAVRAPAYLYGSRDDHIVPWKSAYGSTRILGGDKRFVLGASGHIAGVINPPRANKRSHWTNEDLDVDADTWLAGATEHPGSWWSDWSAWLARFGGAQVAAPPARGGRGFTAMEPAPGRYVREKA